MIFDKWVRALSLSLSSVISVMLSKRKTFYQLPQRPLNILCNLVCVFVLHNQFLIVLNFSWVVTELQQKGPDLQRSKQSKCSPTLQRRALFNKPVLATCWSFSRFPPSPRMSLTNLALCDSSLVGFCFPVLFLFFLAVCNISTWTQEKPSRAGRW